MSRHGADSRQQASEAGGQSEYEGQGQGEGSKRQDEGRHWANIIEYPHVWTLWREEKQWVLSNDSMSWLVVGMILDDFMVKFPSSPVRGGPTIVPKLPICRMLGCVGLLGWGSLSNLASWLTWQNSCFKVYKNGRDCLAFGIPIQTSARHRLQMTPGRDTIGLWCNGSFSPLTSMVISMGDFTHDSRLRFLAKLQVLFLVVTVPSANRVS